MQLFGPEFPIAYHRQYTDLCMSTKSFGLADIWKVWIIEVITENTHLIITI